LLSRSSRANDAQPSRLIKAVEEIQSSGHVPVMPPLGLRSSLPSLPTQMHVVRIKRIREGEQLDKCWLGLVRQLHVLGIVPVQAIADVVHEEVQLVGRGDAPLAVETLAAEQIVDELARPIVDLADDFEFVEADRDWRLLRRKEPHLGHPPCHRCDSGKVLKDDHKLDDVLDAVEVEAKRHALLVGQRGALLLRSPEQRFASATQLQAAPTNLAR
jgi:hypothetical protein